MKKKYLIDDLLIDARDPMSVIEPLWYSINIYESKEVYDSCKEKFNVEQLAVFAIIWFNSEVQNGGIVQFLSNPTGIVWQDALNGFKLLKLEKGVEIFSEIIKYIGSDLLYDQEEREEQIDNLYEQDNDKSELFFGKLDKEYYLFEEDVDLFERLSDFIIENRTKFYFNSEIETFLEDE
jgi:hypothetical protein